MTRVIKVIETTRLIYPQDDSGPVHQHHQHVTPEGTLIVEWCEFQENCEYLKTPYGRDDD
jgi:hypothetical protein